MAKSFVEWDPPLPGLLVATMFGGLRVRTGLAMDPTPSSYPLHPCCTHGLATSRLHLAHSKKQPKT